MSQLERIQSLSQLHWHHGYFPVRYVNADIDRACVTKCLAVADLLLNRSGCFRSAPAANHGFGEILYICVLDVEFFLVARMRPFSRRPGTGRSSYHLEALPLPIKTVNRFPLMASMMRFGVLDSHSNLLRSNDLSIWSVFQKIFLKKLFTSFSFCGTLRLEISKQDQFPT